MKATYGLIGYPLSHSFSKKYFTDKFTRENTNANYELFELERPDKIPALFENKNIQGLNVTIPYKEAVIPFLDSLDDIAKATGAVNCIKIIRNKAGKKTKGFNTDVYGFKQSLKPFLESKHERALIFGTGGASKAVAYVLREIGIDFLHVSRNSSRPGIISYQDLNDYVIQSRLLLINTTPLGMFPGTEKFPHMPYSAVTSDHLLYDLVYNPAETIFLKKGMENGAVTMNGLSMLHLQAEKSFMIWQSEQEIL